MKKKIKRTSNRNFPEGAISAGFISKISDIYLSRALEDAEAADLIPVIIPFSEGKVLEYTGQMKKARDAFKDLLKKNPRNKWVKEALQDVELNLN